MQEWWISLSVFEKVFWYIAVPFSVILIIQLILTFVGMGGGSGDVGAEPVHDGSLPSSDHDGSQMHNDFNTPHFQVFTVRNFVAFFTIFGWAGITGIHSGFPVWGTILFSLFFGIVAMLVVASLFYFIQKLADSGNLIISNAIGATGSVYIPIKKNGENIGKVQVAVQGSLREFQALTKADLDLPTGTPVKVVSVLNDNILEVEKSI